MTTRALLLVGHGSSMGSGAAAPVCAHADRIRTWHIFDEVHTAFWKQEPHVSTALARIRSDEIDVVPLFLADGFFTRDVLPGALGICDSITRTGRQTIRYCPPVGVHPRMADLTLRHAREATTLPAEALGSAALVVVGHGTLRNAMSSSAVSRLCARIRARSIFRDVVPAYLDEPPLVAPTVTRLDSGHIIVVPFLLSEGWHTRQTIPDALQLAGDRTEREGRVLWYARAVGTLPDVARIVVACTQKHRVGSAAATAARAMGCAAPGRRAPWAQPLGTLNG